MGVNKKYIFHIILASVLGIVIIIGMIQKYNIEKDIDENGFLVKAKIEEVVNKRSLRRVYYSYDYNGASFKSNELINSEANLHVDEYYQAKISTKNPSNSRINLNEKLVDK